MGPKCLDICSLEVGPNMFRLLRTEKLADIFRFI